MMPTHRFRAATTVSRASLLIRFGFSLAALCVLSVAAVAQDYRVDKPDETARRNAGLALASVKNPARYTADKDRFEEYFKNFYFKDMTRSGPDDLARLGDSRFKLFKSYLWATDNEELQRDLTEIAFSNARQVIVANNPPYHPAVRYNAVLILGMLDEQYAIDAGARARPPRPHTGARAVLLQIVSAGADDKPVPPALVLGALIGLERHAQFPDSFDAASLTATTNALLKLVNRDQPIQGMDREAYAWLRLRAASALAQLGSLGPKNEVHDAILKLVAEFRLIDDRVAAAALLNKLQYEGAKVDGGAAMATFFKLARDLGAEEAKRAEDFQNSQPGIGGGLGTPGRERMMFGPMSGSGIGEAESFPRRLVLARLVDLRNGLRALKKMTPEDQHAKIDAVIKAIEPVIAAASNKDVVDLKLAATIHTMAAGIDRTTAPAEKAEEAEQKAEEEF